MTLELTRQALLKELDNETAFDFKNQGRIEGLIEAWFKAYKAWEGNDTFLKAFRETRLSIRQGPATQTYEPFEAQRFSQKRKGYLKYKGYKQQVGADSIKSRLDPKNFEDNREGIDRADRNKYKLGLHDLSASLLNPKKSTISEQRRWKYGQKKTQQWLYVFMPLPKPEDLQLFHQLNTLTKKNRAQCPSLYAQLVQIRSKMTRIKLADSVDMGTIFHDVAPKGDTSPLFTYGMKRARSASGSPVDLDMQRYKLAMRYTDIPDIQTGGSNEIVIVYRHHASPRFPIFAQWDELTGDYICREDEDSSNYIQGMIIFDEWEKTKCT